MVEEVLLYGHEINTITPGSLPPGFPSDQFEEVNIRAELVANDSLL